MSDNNQDPSLENDNLEQDQEHLDTRDQDKIENDKVSIPKSDFERIKKQLKTANTEAKERREQLERYNKLGLEPDEIEELLASRDSKSDDSNDDKIDKRELDKQRKSLEQKYKSELENKQAEIDKMQVRLETTLIESAAREAIVAEKGVPDLILGQVTKNAKLFTNDRGGYDVRIVDDNGETEFNNQGEYMTIADQVKTLKADEVFGRAFEATVKRGAGLNHQQGNQKPNTKVSKAELQKDRKAKLAFIKKNGMDEYNALT